MEQFKNSSQSPESKQGKHSKRQFLLLEEDIRQFCRDYVLKKAASDKGRMRVEDFQKFFNSEVSFKFFPSRQPAISISLETARQYLFRLGFKRLHIKSGAYKDGHEQPDNVEERLRFAARVVEVSTTSV